MSDVLSYSVLFLAAASALTAALAYMTRDITFAGADTDNEKQVRSAAAAGEWRWPSDMHKYGSGKTRAKDAFVLLLAFAQRLLRNKDGDHPTVFLCLLTNLVSAQLVLLISNDYWTAGIGLLLAALSLASIWPHWIALFGGHVCVAQMFFLLSIYLMQRGASDLAAGVATGLMLFSSPSARKFLPLTIGAFLYSQQDSLVGFPVWTGTKLLVAMSIPAMLLAVAAIQLSYRSIIKMMYLQTGPHWLSALIEDRSQLSLDHFIGRARELTTLFRKWVLSFAGCLALFVSIGASDAFFHALSYMFCGVILVTLFFALPDIPRNLWHLFAYWNVGMPLGTRFRHYVDYFEKAGKPIDPNMRGAGVSWIPKIFWRIAPFHSAYYLLGVALIGYSAGVRESPASLALAALVMGLSLSPIIVGEVTRGPQVARSYYPGFVGVLLWIGYSTHVFRNTLTPSAELLFAAAATGAVALAAAWSAWTFATDVWPARMAPAFLARTIRRLPGQKLWTYRTPYNDAFVDALPAPFRRSIQINFLRSLDEVDDGYVLVPGTSSKALNMESQKVAIRDGDFSGDPRLEQLIKTRRIAECAVASFKTYGTSRVWAQENEVTSYRDLILREITDEDRWRALAWVLDATKITQQRSAGLESHGHVQA